MDERYENYCGICWARTEHLVETGCLRCRTAMPVIVKTICYTVHLPDGTTRTHERQGIFLPVDQDDSGAHLARTKKPQ